ncbi:MAG: putative glycolipid-binding domain-containing protein [Natronosporangium sp.]
MPYPMSWFWTRTDTAGSDHALVDDRSGLRAQGVAVAATPVPHTCHYELVTDDGWTAVRLAVTAEGAGWLRTVRLEHAADRWVVTTSEQGDLNRALADAGQPRVGLPGIEDQDRLAAAIDLDLGAAPLFNTLPVRRLGLLDAAPGTAHRLTMAWVLVPSLEVLPNEQVYTVLGERRIRYASGDFAADLKLDGAGYVIHYPGLADRC